MLTSDFVHYIRTMPESVDRAVMARIALNSLHDPDEYPVDLSELLNLQATNRHIAQGFIDECAASPQSFQSWAPELTQQLRTEFPVQLMRTTP